MSEMSEQVAKALFVWDEGHETRAASEIVEYWFSQGPDAYGEDADCYRYCQELREQAAVMLKAMRDPTPAMLSAAVNKAKEIGAGDFVGIWRAMIDAAVKEHVK